MDQRLPPLNALRAFMVAARHRSLTRAGAELHVTPAAVGHQVRALEDYLGTRLMIRKGRHLVLSETAQALLPDLERGFAQISAGVGRVRELDTARPLTVSTNVSFCSKWLIPRLDRFRQAHPEIDVRIDASNQLANFTSDGVDVAVRYGRGVYPGLVSERLWEAVVFPVCSPKLPSVKRPLAKPADLRHHSLLHAEWFGQEDTWPDWRMWLLSARLHDIDPEKGLQFNQSTLAIQAAVEGQGVVLASSLLVADDLAAGRLIKPFDLDVNVEFTFFLVYPEERAGHARIRHFRDWLMGEIDERVNSGVNSG